jgi:hypothetical protein
MNALSRDFSSGIKATAPRFAPHRLSAGIAVLVLGCPLAALADCVDMRKPTAGETEFFNRAMAAVLAALPPVPAGGKLRNKDSVHTLGQQCVGMTGDFSPEASRYYEHNHRLSTVTVSINAIRLPVTDASRLSGAYGPASPKRSAGLKVNNVVWTVSGSDSPLRQALVDQIDRARLEAMVGKPLPSVAESQALASQAVPATIAGPAPAPSSPAAQTTAQPATQTATQPANPSAPAPAGQASSSDTVKDTVDTVNKLRGLFGR